jgi:hypothetical protein
MWITWQYIKDMINDLSPWLVAIAIVFIMLFLLGML